jgi:hypothetical protein
MAGVSMNDSLGNTTQKLMNHDGLVVLWNRVESLLNDMASKSIHGKVQSITSNGISNLDDLFRSSMLEAALNQEVSKSIDHQWISLSDDGLNDIILLLGRTNLELLLKED